MITINFLALSCLITGPIQIGIGLGALFEEAERIHPSLSLSPIHRFVPRHVDPKVVTQNPQLSSDPAFIEAIAHSGSQGNLSAVGIRAALYVLYRGEKDVGFYGLEAESLAEADHLESALRKIWAHNESLHRAQVHRAGLVVVVVWTDGIALEDWLSVNERVDQRLSGL
ncbi:MAG: hypothetical protein KDC71_08565 [Acidobacteria bacterium]|nr:hypothetical protein [Acidobacteriota bacterium]